MKCSFCKKQDKDVKSIKDASNQEHFFHPDCLDKLIGMTNKISSNTMRN